MRKEHTPSTVAPPFSRYSHGVEVDAARWLLISGQVGVDREGRLAEGAAAQMDQAWRNILAILDDAGMDAGNLVKITAYLTRRDDLKAFREMRDRHLPDVNPARSAERRVGKEWVSSWRSRWSTYHEKKNKPKKADNK